MPTAAQIRTYYLSSGIGSDQQSLVDVSPAVWKSANWPVRDYEYVTTDDDVIPAAQRNLLFGHSVTQAPREGLLEFELNNLEHSVDRYRSDETANWSGGFKWGSYCGVMFPRPDFEKPKDGLRNNRKFPERPLPERSEPNPLSERARLIDEAVASEVRRQRERQRRVQKRIAETARLLDLGTLTIEEIAASVGVEPVLVRHFAAGRYAVR